LAAKVFDIYLSRFNDCLHQPPDNETAVQCGITVAPTSSEYHDISVAPCHDEPTEVDGNDMGIAESLTKFR